jgi:hypothetical protein
MLFLRPGFTDRSLVPLRVEYSHRFCSECPVLCVTAQDKSLQRHSPRPLGYSQGGYLPKE